MTEWRRLPFDAPADMIVPQEAQPQTPVDLYFMAGRMFRPQHILEIGCARGGSAVALLQGAMPTANKIVLIDSEGSHIDHTAGLIIQHFAGQVQVGSMVARSDADHVRAWLRDLVREQGRFDFCHIDGEHNYGAGCNDLRLCWESTAPGGILMGHDTHSDDPNHADLARAWAEFADQYRNDLGWRWELPQHPGITLIGKGTWAS